MADINDTKIFSHFQLPSNKSKQYVTEIDYLHNNSVFYGANFIIVCGIKLKAHPVVIATAARLFHQFFREAKTEDYDVYVISVTALNLAGKIEDKILKVRDIINVAYNTLHPGEEPLDMKKHSHLRNTIVKAELLIMRMLQYKVDEIHPHQYLLHYIKSLECWLEPEIWWKTPIVSTCWKILQDLHHDSFFIDYKPQHIAIAVIYLTLLIYGIQVPFEENIPVHWYEAMSDDVKDVLLDIIDKILNIYDQEDKFATIPLTI